MENNKILPIIFLLSLSSSIYLFIKNFNFISFSIFLDFFSILMLNYYLSPTDLHFIFASSRDPLNCRLLFTKKSNYQMDFGYFLKKHYL